MREMRPIVLLASAAALTLAIGQGVRAELIASDAAAEAPAGKATAPAGPTESAPAAAPTAEAAPAEAAPAPAAASTEAAPAETSATAEAPAVAEPAADAAAASQPPSAPSPADAARARMEQREAQMMEQRRLRYDELRTRAAEVGLNLPEIPPWEQAGVHPLEMPTPPDMPAPPEMPSMPAPPEMPQPPGMTPPSGPEARAGMSPDEMDAMREQRYQAMRERAKQRGVELPETPPWKLMTQEERQAHWETMRNMSPEQRQAMREAHWQEMRERAKAQGIEMPELPPWKQAEQRRQEMQAEWEKYRSIVDQMSEEQREAAEAVFGQAARQVPPRPMPPRMPMQAPYGSDYGMPSGPMMPGYGGQGVGPGMSEWGTGDPWGGGNQGMYQVPPRPEAGYGQPW